MVTESWKLLGRSAEEVIVSQNAGGRVTNYFMRPHGRTWRIFEITFSKPNAGCNLTTERHKHYDGQCLEFRGGCWDRQCHPNGIRLTLSRQHRILTEFCDGTRV